MEIVRLSGDPLIQDSLRNVVISKKISCLENAKEIWDTLIDMHEGTDSIKESKLDVEGVLD